MSAPLHLSRRRVLQASAAATGLSFFSFRPTAALAQMAAAAGGAAASVLGAPRLALVIGNDRYRDSPLKNPVNDARSISAELQASDFAVTTLLDAGLADMRARVDAFGRDLAKTKGVGVFYFAGHGLQLSWRNYLLPVDTQIANTEEVPRKAVDLAQLLDTMGKAGNPANIVILDACRNNPFGRDFRVEQKGLSQVDAPVGTLLAYATAPGNVAIDGEGTNGLYTEHLLKEMRVQDAKVEDIFKRVRLAVRRQSKGFQIPWESTSLEEDFYFQPPEELRKVAEAERQKRVEAEREAQRVEAERRKKEEDERLAREKAAAEERKRLEEELRRQQVAEAERQRKLKEAEDARAKAEAEALRKADEERRVRTAADLARQQKEAEAALARQQAEAARRRKLEEERAAKERDEEARKKRYEAELAQWENLVESSDPAAFADFLYRHPNGSFSELAQARLDHLLAKQGEKRVEVVSAPENPFSKGTARLDTAYKVGDRYEYRVVDLQTKNPLRKIVQRVTEVRDNAVVYNDGRIIFDLLGNTLQDARGRQYATQQHFVSEYSVGRRWTTRFTRTGEKGGEVSFEIEYRVVGRENVIVPAGTFDCFVVRGEAVIADRTGWRTQQRWGEDRFWMAPGVLRRFVAREQTRRQGGTLRVNERVELVAYRQG